LEFLASAEDGTEDRVIQATARIGRLLEMAVDAARALERRARKAGENAVQISKLIVPKGRRGDPAMNIWIGDMMGIYKEITGRPPRVSQIAKGPNRGKAAGPFVRFLEAASCPLIRQGEPLCLNSLRERVRDFSTSARGQK
jgi:hypothetical protein